MTFTDPIPFDEAIAVAQRKGILPNNLSSAQLSQLKKDLLQRAVFSARMDKASVLQTLQDNLDAIVSGVKDERGVFRSIPEAKAQLREAMFEAGVPIARVGTPKIKDFYSDTRRDLIVRTTVLDTFGFGQHVAAQDPAMLFAAPAQELVRFSEPKGQERDWVQRWHDAMDEVGDDGCTDPDECGRMVALKNHPIWQALGDGAGGYTDTLGNAWAPFAFNSGMGTIDVSRDDAVALGIIGADDEVKPDDSFDMNESLEASVEKFSAGIQDALSGGGLRVLDGVLKVIRNRQRRRRMDALLVILNSGTSDGARRGWETRRANAQAAISSVLKGDQQKADYAPVTPAEAARIKEATGIDATGYKHAISQDYVRHIAKRHGPGNEKRADQDPITEDDYAKIPSIVSNPDRVVDGGKTGMGLRSIKYFKKIGTDHMVVEEVWSRDRRLMVKTFFKKKAVLPNRATPEGGVVHTSKTYRTATVNIGASRARLKRVLTKLQEAALC